MHAHVAQCELFELRGLAIFDRETGAPLLSIKADLLHGDESRPLRRGGSARDFRPAKLTQVLAAVHGQFPSQPLRPSLTHLYHLFALSMRGKLVDAVLFLADPLLASTSASASASAETLRAHDHHGEKNDHHGDKDDRTATVAAAERCRARAGVLFVQSREYLELLLLSLLVSFEREFHVALERLVSQEHKRVEEMMRADTGAGQWQADSGNKCESNGTERTLRCDANVSFSTRQFSVSCWPAVESFLRRALSIFGAEDAIAIPPPLDGSDAQAPALLWARASSSSWACHSAAADVTAADTSAGPRPHSSWQEMLWREPAVSCVAVLAVDPSEASASASASAVPLLPLPRLLYSATRDDHLHLHALRAARPLPSDRELPYPIHAMPSASAASNGAWGHACPAFPALRTEEMRCIWPVVAAYASKWINAQYSLLRTNNHDDDDDDDDKFDNTDSFSNTLSSLYLGATANDTCAPPPSLHRSLLLTPKRSVHNFATFAVPVSSPSAFSWSRPQVDARRGKNKRPLGLGSSVSALPFADSVTLTFRGPFVRAAREAHVLMRAVELHAPAVIAAVCLSTAAPVKDDADAAVSVCVRTTTVFAFTCLCLPRLPPPPPLSLSLHSPPPPCTKFFLHFLF